MSWPTRRNKIEKRFQSSSYALLAHALRRHIRPSSQMNSARQKLYIARRKIMARGFLLWLLGVPFGLIVLLWLFGFLS
jgi:hypothetical protein